jgi:hypothetical protein
MTQTSADYDNPWKLMLESYFREFVAFFFPQVHDQIDWERQYESLDKEFQQVVRDAELGKRLVDKLVKVWLRNGEEIWVLAHIEIQNQPETGFSERVYVYNYRIYDRYRQRVASLALLTDERASWRPSQFGYELFGCQVQFQFPIVKLLDYKEQWQALEESRNPFAIVVMAHLKTQETRDNGVERKAWKFSLIKRLYEKGYQKQDVLNLFNFIDWLMNLPDALNREFWQELTQYEEQRRMPYITSVERMALKDGQRLVIENMLKVRFGTLDEPLAAIIPALLEMLPEEYTPLLFQLSREELLNRFQPT